MQDIRLFKNTSNGLKAETLVEGHGVELGMEAKSTGPLAFSFGDDGMHETGAKAQMVLDG